jgi:hypothetical protein
LGSRPDRFCPFAIVASNRDCLWMMMRHSQIKWLVPAYFGGQRRGTILRRLAVTFRTPGRSQSDRIASIQRS